MDIANNFTIARSLLMKIEKSSFNYTYLTEVLYN